MIAVLSPAKALDFETPPTTELYTTAALLDRADELVDRCRTLSAKDLQGLMKISDKLAELNVERFADYERPLYPGPDTKQAALAFAGDTYTGFDAGSMSEADLSWAQDHVRILSGLYGVLRPLDLMRPYRLEMGSRLKTDRGSNLYEFWGSSLAESLSDALDRSGPRVLVNCASKEYFGAVDLDALGARVITPVFKDRKGDAYRVISFWAKRARGAMASYMVRHRVDDPEGLKEYDFEGYAFDEGLSEGDEWVFTRDGSA